MITAWVEDKTPPPSPELDIKLTINIKTFEQLKYLYNLFNIKTRDFKEAFTPANKYDFNPQAVESFSALIFDRLSVASVKYL